MNKYSDKFSSCARPEIQEVIVVQGTRVQVQKIWEHYTEREKGLAMNYKFGCGAEIVEFILHLESELEQLKVQFAALANATAATFDNEVNDNFKTLEMTVTEIEKKLSNLPANGIATTQSVGDVTREITARIDQVSEEVERRVTPEYLSWMEHEMFTRLDEAFEAIKMLSDRITAIDTAKS